MTEGNSLYTCLPHFLRGQANPTDGLHNITEFCFYCRFDKYLLIDHYMTVLGRVSREKETIGHMYEKRCFVQNWFTQLWRLRSAPICHLQARDPGKLVI